MTFNGVEKKRREKVFHFPVNASPFFFFFHSSPPSSVLMDWDESTE